MLRRWKIFWFACDLHCRVCRGDTYPVTYSSIAASPECRQIFTTLVIQVRALIRLQAVHFRRWNRAPTGNSESPEARRVMSGRVSVPSEKWEMSLYSSGSKNGYQHVEPRWCEMADDSRDLQYSLCSSLLLVCTPIRLQFYVRFMFVVSLDLVNIVTYSEVLWFICAQWLTVTTSPDSWSSVIIAPVENHPFHTSFLSYILLTCK